MSVSTVPAVLDALVQRVGLALPGVQVTDGQPVDVEPPDTVCIGFTGTPGEAVVVSMLSPEQMAVTPDRESYTVACVASCWKGHERDAKAVRDRAYALVDAVDAELARDPTLGGLVLRARLATEELIPEQTAEGALATVKFSVSVDAFAGR
ncbi:hypothetical protein [Actinomadura rupiterrae]|uniref:hypothetical protein n=1 Tax=Actinomadura rupiterrae TaxID=559627 RepID=UPI0020A48A3C|nr:hypothetical protein [Actinomadura rupiterrae]MCP2339166.1 hypothetical protein [Actinomadura rupiterrae]